jgi:hypothetical protein
MEKMKDILNKPRKQPKMRKIESLNRRARKAEMNRIDFENKLMADRLKKINPVISNKKIKDSYKLHKTKAEQFRRKSFRRPDMNQMPDSSWVYPLEESKLGTSYLAESEFGEINRGSNTLTATSVMDMRRKLSEDRLRRRMEEKERHHQGSSRRKNRTSTPNSFYLPTDTQTTSSSSDMMFPSPSLQPPNPHV